MFSFAALAVAGQWGIGLLKNPYLKIRIGTSVCKCDACFARNCMWSTIGLN